MFLGEHVLRRADHGKRESEVIQRAKHPRKNHRISYVRAVPRHLKVLTLPFEEFLAASEEEVYSIEEWSRDP